jgi:cleavage and polyadenylation specificity factor subunit 1
LKEYKDTVKLIIFTLDFVTQNYPIIRTVEGLPHDCLFLLPCATSLGGVVIVTCNSIIYVDQSSKRVPLPVNGWPTRISDLPMPAITPENHLRNLELEGCRAAFVDDKTIFIIHRDGTVYPIDMVIDGKTVSKLTLKPELAQTTIPTVVKRIADGHIFIGSTVGPSVLLKAVHVEEEIGEHEMDVTPTAVVQMHNNMDMDDEDDGRRLLYDLSTAADFHGNRYLWAFQGCRTIQKWSCKRETFKTHENCHSTVTVRLVTRLRSNC